MPEVPPRRAGRIAFAVSFVGMMMMFAHKGNGMLTASAYTIPRSRPLTTSECREIIIG